MRLTYKKLIEYINQALERVGANDIEAFEAYNPRFRGQDIENGAALIIVRFGAKGENMFGSAEMFSFCYTIKDFERELNKGAVIGFDLNPRFGRLGGWNDAEIKPVYLKPHPLRTRANNG